MEIAKAIFRVGPRLRFAPRGPIYSHRRLLRLEDRGWPSPTVARRSRRSRTSTQIDAFIEAARRVPAPGSGSRGRLIFALDATMSRQATWDLAQSLQGRMFEAAPESAAWTCNSSISAAWANAAPRGSFREGRASPR